MPRFRLSHLLFLFALLLAGPMPAKSQAEAPESLAAACAPFSGYSYTDFSAELEAQAEAVTNLCGGEDGLAPQLTQLLHAPSVEVRRDAAAALGFREIFLNYVITGADSKAEADQKVVFYHQQFERYNQLAVPALTACLQDKDDGVRLAALHALEGLTWNSQDAPWSATVPAVSQAAASTNPILHLPALRVLAYMPADVSPAASSLRLGLHGTKEERSYTLAAIIHAGQTNRNVTLNAFLPDLAAPSLAKRRQVIGDISLAVVPLWTRDFIMQYPLPDWSTDSRLSAGFDRMSFKLASWSRTQEKRQVATERAQARLLAALVKAAADPDYLLRYDAALSLEQIADWTYNGLGWGIKPNPARTSRLEVEQALAQAAASLKAPNPILAERLQQLSAEVTQGPDSAQ